MKPLAIFLALTVAAGAEDLIPQVLPKDRYADTIGKSPFVLETKATDAPAIEKINPFQNLYLRGVGKAEGKDYVLVQRLGEERPMRFIGNEAGPDELVVKSVRIGNSFRETKVVLQKGLETGEVGFKEDTINTPPPATGQNRGPAVPGQFPKPGTTMQPPVPVVRQTQPNIPVQAVPRPGSIAPMPHPTAPQPVAIPQSPGTPKTRLRVINN